jgi:putative hemolysin
MKSKRFVLLGGLILVALLSTGCASATEEAQLANPAAVYCREQGYTLEIRTDADGGQYGVCIFPDGRECDAWAFYRGECVPVGAGASSGQATSSPPTEEPGINVVALAGLATTIQIEILELDASSGAYVHRAVVGQPPSVAQAVGALDVNLEPIPRARRPAQYVLRFVLRDGSAQELGYTAEQASFLRGDQDFWQGQDVEPPTQFDALIQEWLAAAPAQVAVVGWYGQVLSTPDGAQHDDYLSLMPPGVGEVGLRGADDAVETEIESLRDSGTYAHFWGALTCGVLDYGACRLVVDRLRVDGPGPLFAPDPVEGWEGIVASNPPMAQFDDHFTLTGDFLIMYGIDSSDSDVLAQLENARQTLSPVRVWGQVTCGVPDENGCQIAVTRIEAVDSP